MIIGIPLALLIGYFILKQLGVFGVKSDAEKAVRHAVENEPALNSAFFNGDETVTFVTPGNNLPPKLVIESAPHYGYRLVSETDGEHGTKTLVFERA